MIGGNMKRMFLLLMLVPSLSFAGPYFRFVGRDFFILNTGSCLDPMDVKDESSVCGSIPVIAHSHKDGFLILPEEDWALLTVGGGLAHGDARVNIGPSWNISPTLKGLLLMGLNSATKDGSFSNLKDVLAPEKDGKPDMTIALSPLWEYSPMTNKGYFRIFIGPSWSF